MQRDTGQYLGIALDEATVEQGNDNIGRYLVFASRLRLERQRCRQRGGTALLPTPAVDAQLMGSVRVVRLKIVARPAGIPKIVERVRAELRPVLGVVDLDGLSGADVGDPQLTDSV
jgi:hypothetical protein